MRNHTLTPDFPAVSGKSDRQDQNYEAMFTLLLLFGVDDFELCDYYKSMTPVVYHGMQAVESSTSALTG